MTKEELLKVDPYFLAYEDDIQEYFDVEIPDEVEAEALEAQRKKDEYFQTYISKETNNKEREKFIKEYNKLPSKYEVKEVYITSIVKFPKSELVYQEGGGEGEGEYCCWVRFYPELNLYLEIEGEYSSYEGVEFDSRHCVTEVEPREVVVTKYFRKYD